jgi:hypothetical protein
MMEVGLLKVMNMMKMMNDRVMKVSILTQIALHEVHCNTQNMKRREL